MFFAGNPGRKDEEAIENSIELGERLQKRPGTPDFREKKRIE